MHQYINRNKIYFYLFLFLFLTTISNLTLINNFEKNFLIKNIIVKLDKSELNSKVLLNFSYLIDKNIFLIEKKNLLEKMKKIQDQQKFKLPF